MSSKHVTETLTGYFDELLDGNAAKTPAVKQPTPDKPLEADLVENKDESKDSAEQAREETVQKSEATTLTQQHSPNTEGAHNNINVDSANTNSTKADNASKKANAPTELKDKPLSDVGTTKEIVQEKVLIQDTGTQINNEGKEGARSASVRQLTNIPVSPSEKKVPSETAPAEPLKEDTASAPATHYEQHKQRLEKMLQQVTVLDGQPESKALPKEAAVESTAKALKSTDVDSLPQDEATTEALVDADYEPLPPISSEWLENGRPNWAQDRFDILLIEVNGLQLAVPLVALGQIQPIEEDLTPLFGQSDWFMGLQKTAIGNVKTVNTAKFVMPERYQDDHDYKYVVSINGLSWGLAVDCIHQPISIDPDDIRWRGKRGSRPWMAGMVKDHMCVLLDIPSMGEILQEQDKNHA
ncbi:MAG: chemotaxis protein CheW [Cellvibrionaceae bacterium]